jgi:hypothetical protein
LFLRESRKFERRLLLVDDWDGKDELILLFCKIPPIQDIVFESEEEGRYLDLSLMP